MDGEERRGEERRQTSEAAPKGPSIRRMGAPFFAYLNTKREEERGDERRAGEEKRRGGALDIFA